MVLLYIYIAFWIMSRGVAYVISYHNPPPKQIQRLLTIAALPLLGELLFFRFLQVAFEEDNDS